MQSYLHLVMIPFTGVGIPGFRSLEWYKDRIEIFKNYTLKSLLNQRDQNFILWITFRPEEENNPSTAELANYLKSKDLQYILTFDGLMYHDDKFTRMAWPMIKNAARMVRACYRNRTWNQFISFLGQVFQDKNRTLGDRIARSVGLIQQYYGGVDWVLVSRIDSDDMFHRDYISRVHRSNPLFSGALVVNKGFIYNRDTDQLAEYYPHTNPPFHTIMFPSNTFFNASLHIDFYKNFTSHEDIPKVFEYSYLPDFLYCVLTHNPKNHISTVWNHPFRGREIKEEDTKRALLKQFGI